MAREPNEADETVLVALLPTRESAFTAPAFTAPIEDVKRQNGLESFRATEAPVRAVNSNTLEKDGISTVDLW